MQPILHAVARAPLFGDSASWINAGRLLRGRMPAGRKSAMHTGYEQGYRVITLSE
jgi:hypothetical protein